ncbi:MAG: TlpA family protein disulfide reductase [Acidobacteria bacterium]|nr:TlpA family protein disulfide reductase [Acidobacteriota bacterium]
MTNSNDTQQWVDTKMQALQPGHSADQGMDSALRILRQRKAPTRSLATRASILGVTFTLVGLAAVLPDTQAFAARCLEACRAAVGVSDTAASTDASALAPYRGKVLAVNFWATWCAPCREELPALESIRQRLESSGLAMVGVSVDDGDWDSVLAFASQQRLGFKLEKPSSELAKFFGPIEALPVTVLMDREGKQIARINGKIDAGALERQILAALNAPASDSTAR